MIALTPLPGRILVELCDRYEHVATTEQKYDTRTSGICIDVGPTPYNLVGKVSPDEFDSAAQGLKGKRVFWEEYKDGAVIEREGKKYAFIKIEDLDGYEDV